MGVSNRCTGFSTGTGMGLERGTGLFDWNVGLDYLTGTWDWTTGLEHCPQKYTYHARQRVSLIAGLDSPLEHGTGMWDWII